VNDLFNLQINVLYSNGEWQLSCAIVVGIILMFLYGWSFWNLNFRFYRFKTDHEFAMTFDTLIYGLREGGKWVSGY